MTTCVTVEFKGHWISKLAIEILRQTFPQDPPWKASFWLTCDQSNSFFLRSANANWQKYLWLLCWHDNEPMGKKTAGVNCCVCSTLYSRPSQDEVGSPSAGIRALGSHRHATGTDLDPDGTGGHDTARQADQCLTRRHNSKHTSGGRVWAQKGVKGRGGGGKAGETRQSRWR